MKRFEQLAQRLFNVPLAIHPGKAEIIVAALAQRMGITRPVRVNGRALSPGDSDFAAGPDAAADEDRGPGYAIASGVAIIDIQGTLVQRLGVLRPYSGMTCYGGIRQNFYAALDDPEVHGICLSIDSPGGEAAGCLDLVDAMYAMRGEKPCWAILSERAYGGAYAIASAADRIVVPRTGGVGSIGVILMHVDWSRALTEAGVEVSVMQYSKHACKDDMHLKVPLPEQARQHLQSQIDAVGDLFVETIARNRSLPTEAVCATGGATFLGAETLERGLTDAVMSPDAAFRAMLSELHAG